MEHVPNGHKSRLRELLIEQAIIFDRSLGEINSFAYCISLTTETKPELSPHYREAPETTEIMRDDVEKLLKAGVIEPGK